MIISPKVMELLVCPDCRVGLTPADDRLECSSCGQAFPLAAGVICFPESTAYPAPPFYNNPEYKQAEKRLAELHQLHYAAGSLSGGLEGYFKRELMKLVINLERPIVDIGCGAGAAFGYLGYPDEIVGIDINLDLLTQCKARHPESDCIKCDVLRSPIKDGSLETVFSIFSLEHIFYLEAFVMSVERMLSATGCLYAAIPTEGGLAWSMLRNIAHLKYSKRLGINYKLLAQTQHCNKAVTIDNTLQKFFIIDQRRDIPWRLGGINLNMARLYRLRKRG